MRCGYQLAAIPLMTEPTDARKRILALHERALNFSNRINQTYRTGAMNYPSRVVWDQLVRAAIFATIVKNAAGKQ